MQIAAVAAARKLAIIAWHVLSKDEDYDWVRPALTQRKIRALELQSGFKSEKGGRRGRACDYNLPIIVREQEVAAALLSERLRALRRELENEWTEEQVKACDDSTRIG
jgi:hypothetical protein